MAVSCAPFYRFSSRPFFLLLLFPADPNENTFRYVISLPFPTTANAANAGGGNSSNTVHLATGKVILKSLAPPPSTAPAETSGTAPPPSTAPAAAAPSTASGTAKADAGKGAAAKGGKDAAAAPALSAADAAAAAGPWIWCVEWKASKLFLHKSSVTALQAHIASGNSLDGTFRRVQIEAVEEDDPLDPVFGLEQGLRLAEEDYAYRGAVSLVLDSLLTAGETVLKTETDLKPPVDPVSEEEKAADATAKATRDAQWAEYQANKAKAAGGKGGKDAKGGKAPAKGKDAKGKDAKGKDAKGKDAKGGKGGADAGPAENAAPPPHPFIAAGSFVRYNLTLNTPLNPRPPTPPPVKISASDLIPSRPKPLQQPPGLDASQSFRREVANAVVAIAREYSLTIQRLQAQQQQQQQQQGGGGGNIPEEVKRRELLASLKTSGVYSSMKSTFKTAALRIAKERFSHMPGAADPSGSLGRDMLVSYLYAYLIGQMHAAVNSSLGEAELAASLVTGIEGVMNSMGAGAGAQQGQGQGQGQGAAPAAAGPGEGETASMRLRRIALECESSGRFARAERCHQSRVMHLEEASAKGSSLGVYASLPAWHDFALFYCRRGGKAYLKALTCLREALSIDSKFIPSLVLAASVQAIRGQLEEALVYSDSAMHLCEEALGGPSASRGEQQEVNPADPFVNAAPLCYGLHSLLLTLKGSNKSEESGHALLEGTSALQQLLISRGLPEEEAQRCGTAGAILLIVSRSLLSAGLNSLARKSLQLAADALADTDAPPSQKADLLILRAKWFLQTVNALASVELKENTASQDVSDASDGQLTAADAAVGAAAVGGGGAPVRRKSRGPAGQGGLDATVASLAAGNAPGASSGGIAGGSSGAGTASGSNPLHFTALGIRVPISLTSGKAYDGAPVTGAQCEAELDKALALTASAGIGNGNGAPEAWFLKASLHLSGLLQPDSNLPLPLYGEGSGVDGNTILGGVVGGGGGPSISVGIPSVLAGSPDPADVDPIDVNRAIACLEMAMGNHLEPVGLSAGGGMVSSFLNRAPLSVTGLPALMAAATASASSEEEAQQAVMTLVSAEVSSYGNVGGGCLHDDEFHGARTYLLCASLHLHMSTVASDTTPMAGPPGVVSRTAGQHLEAARESFLRAAEATRSVHSESSPAEAAAHAALTTELAGAGHMSAAAAAVSSSSAQPSFQQTKAWSIALLGLGRVAWASNDAVLAEALLSEANVLDNQNSSVWGWLAFLCLNSEPLRDREAAASIDQALKLVSQRAVPSVFFCLFSSAASSSSFSLFLLLLSFLCSRCRGLSATTPRPPSCCKDWRIATGS